MAYDGVASADGAINGFGAWIMKRVVEAFQVRDLRIGLKEDDKRIVDLDKVIEKLSDAIANLNKAMNKYYCGPLTYDKDKCAEPGAMKPGSLGYLSVESHSVSRRTLHPEVIDFLNRQLNA